MEKATLTPTLTNQLIQLLSTNTYSVVKCIDYQGYPIYDCHCDATNINYLFTTSASIPVNCKSVCIFTWDFITLDGIDTNIQVLNNFIPLTTINDTFGTTLDDKDSFIPRLTNLYTPSPLRLNTINYVQYPNMATPDWVSRKHFGYRCRKCKITTKEKNCLICKDDLSNNRTRFYSYVQNIPTGDTIYYFSTKIQNLDYFCKFIHLALIHEDDIYCLNYNNSINQLPIHSMKTILSLGTVFLDLTNNVFLFRGQLRDNSESQAIMEPNKVYQYDQDSDMATECENLTPKIIKNIIHIIENCLYNLVKIVTRQGISFYDAHAYKWHNNSVVSQDIPNIKPGLYLCRFLCAINYPDVYECTKRLLYWLPASEINIPGVINLQNTQGQYLPRMYRGQISMPLVCDGLMFLKIPSLSSSMTSCAGMKCQVCGIVFIGGLCPICQTNTNLLHDMINIISTTEKLNYYLPCVDILKGPEEYTYPMYKVNNNLHIISINNA
jgi:hypothetical protein